MSNLNLPKLDYKSLSGSLSGTLNRPPTKIAYATTAQRASLNDAILIRHHENLIAVIQPFSVMINNAGWVSSTTTNRIHQVLRDNRIPWRFAMSRGENWLTSDDFKYMLGSCNEAVFEMRSGLWALTEANGFQYSTPLVDVTQ